MKDYIHSKKGFKETYNDTLAQRKKMDPTLKKYFMLGINSMFNSADSISSFVPVLGTAVDVITDLAVVPTNLVADLLFHPAMQKFTTAMGTIPAVITKKYVNANIAVYDKLINAVFGRPIKAIKKTVNNFRDKVAKPKKEGKS